MAEGQRTWTTPVLRRIQDRILRGERGEDIADELGINYNTMRSMLSHHRFVDREAHARRLRGDRWKVYICKDKGYTWPQALEYVEKNHGYQGSLGGLKQGVRRYRAAITHHPPTRAPTRTCKGAADE
jgi:DNA-directed RNA polymerase subunit N (RpoN/RPB10)